VSSYKKSLTLCLLLFLFLGCSNKALEVEKKEPEKPKIVEVKTTFFDQENQYIVLALELENQGLYYDAKDLYLTLFEKTNEYEYFARYLSIVAELKDYELTKKQALKYYLPNIKQEELILRLYTFSLFKLEEKKDALINGEKLAKLFPNAMNYELLGTIYLQDKNYVKAYEQFNKAYDLDKSVNSFMNLTSVQYFDLQEKDDAIKRIEEYIKLNGYDFSLSIQLLSFYEKEQKTEKIVPFLKEMYQEYKKNNEALLTSKTKVMLVKYIAKDNVAMAINFLEENHEEDEILLNLYKITNQPQKAYDLLGVLFTKSNNLDYLAQQAIIQFEMAEDKRKVLNDVIPKFELVLMTNNSIYQNYLAYIYIDYDINVKRGLLLVKKALEQDPVNLAYLDTLAWGEYKVKNCKESLKQMKKVVDEIGLDDAEIKMHWQKIKECKK